MEHTKLDFDDIEESPDSPAGSWREGYEIYEETNALLVDGIRALIEYKNNDRWIYLSEPYPKLTVHHCWSGYSTYTITSQWDEIEIDWDGHHYFFEHMSLFFKALEEAKAWQKNW